MRNTLFAPFCFGLKRVVTGVIGHCAVGLKRIGVIGEDRRNTVCLYWLNMSGFNNNGRSARLSWTRAEKCLTSIREARPRGHKMWGQGQNNPSSFYWIDCFQSLNQNKLAFSGFDCIQNTHFCLISDKHSLFWCFFFGT